MAEYENVLDGKGAAANRTERLIIQLSPVEAVSLIQTLAAQLIKVGSGHVFSAAMTPIGEPSAKQEWLNICIDHSKV